MAVEGPDPKTFGSWEEAFQYPVATVRAMERQLRSDIELNRERLRTLVGYVIICLLQNHYLSSARYSGNANAWC